MTMLAADGNAQDGAGYARAFSLACPHQKHALVLGNCL